KNILVIGWGLFSVAFFRQTPPFVQRIRKKISNYLLDIIPLLSYHLYDRYYSRSIIQEVKPI
ncbi:MAG: hypothetical protein AB1420_17600, partial [Bacillota bacterium]